MKLTVGKVEVLVAVGVELVKIASNSLGGARADRGHVIAFTVATCKLVGGDSQTMMGVM